MKTVSDLRNSITILEMNATALKARVATLSQSDAAKAAQILELQARVADLESNVVTDLTEEVARIDAVSADQAAILAEPPVEV